MKKDYLTTIDHRRKICNDSKTSYDVNIGSTLDTNLGNDSRVVCAQHYEPIEPMRNHLHAAAGGEIPQRLTLFGILPEADLTTQAKLHENLVNDLPRTPPSHTISDVANFPIHKVDCEWTPRMEFVKHRDETTINALEDWTHGQTELERTKDFYVAMGDLYLEEFGEDSSKKPWVISAITEKPPAPFDEQLDRLIKNYPEVFKDSLNLRAETAVSLEINLDGVYKTPYCYQVPNAYRDQAEAKINEMLAAGIIRPSSSPYRAVNAVTIPDSYTLPSIEYIKMHIKGKVFSSLDLREGFMQVTVAEKDRPKTAVKTPWGLFEYNRMPFGLRNAPPTFQRFINSVLHGIPNIFVYIDDVVIYTDDYDKHLQIVEMVLTRLNDNGLIINAEKSTFLATQITYLGMDFDENGYRPVETCLPKIQNYSAPRDRKGIQKFLGVINYYRSHIPNLASVAAPLYRLLNKATKFVWGDRECESFDLLKTLFQQRLRLYPLVTTGKIELFTDASDVACGAVLTQDSKPIEFYSRTFTPVECRYSTFERETLAMVTSILHFRNILIGTPFTLWTDHKPLMSWLVRPPKTERHARWLVKLQDYRRTKCACGFNVST
jgi:hypothetical protein